MSQKITLSLDAYDLALLDEFISIENCDMSIKALINKFVDNNSLSHINNIDLKEDLEKFAYRIKTRRAKILSNLLCKLACNIGYMKEDGYYIKGAEVLQNNVCVEISNQTIDEIIELKNKILHLEKLIVNDEMQNLDKLLEDKEYLLVEFTEHSYEFLMSLAIQLGYKHDQFTNEYKLLNH